MKIPSSSHYSFLCCWCFGTGREKTTYTCKKTNFFGNAGDVYYDCLSFMKKREEKNKEGGILYCNREGGGRRHFILGLFITFTLMYASLKRKKGESW